MANAKMHLKKEAASPFVPVEEQPYEVPKNWCWVRLNVLKDGISGFFDGDWILSENMDDNGKIRLLQLSDIGLGEFLDKSNKHINENTFEKLNCTELVKGDVMISRMAEPIARSCIVPQLSYRVITAVDVAVLRCNKHIVRNEYVNHFCNVKWFTDMALKRARGTTRVRITRKSLGEMPIPLPPLPEQQRIVDRIESLFAKLDEAKEKAQAAVDGFELRKSAILHKAFTGELTAQWRKEHGVGMESWTKTTLSKASSSIGDGLHGTPIFDETGDCFFVNGNNFSGYSIEVKPDTKRVCRSEYEKYKIELSEKTVFVSINGTLGKTAFYDCEHIVLGKSACYVNVAQNLNKYYLRYYFCSKEFFDYAHEKATGSTIKNLGLKAMRNLPLELPSMPEQQEIVRILDMTLIKEQESAEAAESVLDQIDTMKKAILARAFRGELGTNNQDEESAAEFLMRI